MEGRDLVHVRHGALLHDIGKIRVPESILLKPGPLTEEEWKIMREHPSYAFELMSEVPYLRAAVNIPFCHHEKWDGSGYPRGLKGKEIPLAARVFAVVEAWDLLSSDRPFRKAWIPEKIREHLRSHSGIDFDPDIVEKFLELERQGAFAPAALPESIPEEKIEEQAVQEERPVQEEKPIEEETPIEEEKTVEEEEPKPRGQLPKPKTFLP